jgi:hypothetical protein
LHRLVACSRLHMRFSLAEAVSLPVYPKIMGKRSLTMNIRRSGPLQVRLNSWQTNVRICNMKMIVAVIWPDKRDDVVDALETQNVPGVTITDVHECGEQGGICPQYHAGSYPTEGEAGNRHPGYGGRYYLSRRSVSMHGRIRRETCVSLCCRLLQLHGYVLMTSS